MADNLRPEEQVDRAEVQRDAALNIAADEAVNRDIAEADAVDARIQANQANAAAREAATHRNILSHELAHERTASANNAFGFYLMVGILVAALLVTGIYLYWRAERQDEVLAATPNPAPTHSVVVTPPAPSAPAPASPAPVIINPPAPAQSSPPPNINVTPPPVHNNITVTPPAPASPGSTENGASGTDRSGGTDTGADTGTTSP